MRQKLLKVRTDWELKKNKVLHGTVPYKEALNVGVIFTVEDKQKHEAIKEFIKKLEHDGKKVQVIEFLPKDKENYEFKFDFFSENDLSFWGQVTAENAIRFSDAPFDYLFYIDITPNPFILYLLARGKARCRVGRSWPETRPYFEFMIESINSNQSLIEGMYKYTSQLR
ncbi:hypothetical protein [Chryseolinea sp. H1M3-3]|uniref:DUF6913 domain-containing protein n=1 Tax=Chryseolinea sp. H1M3-3 TaxID=3034144 RepID=UPI0023ED09F5|nr:hypothetical protein [Chryseolinea sp. H1M3-3]